MYTINLKPEAQDFLDNYLAHCPSAVIAGGYLRDLEAGVEPTDIDVFLPAKELQTALVVYKKEQRKKGPVKTAVLVCSSKEEYDSSAFTSFRFAGEEALNVIAINDLSMTSASEVVTYCNNRFDVDLCKVYYILKSKKIHKAASYERDIRHKAITYHVSRINQANLDKRIAKLQKKFPTYRLRFTYQGQMYE